MGLFVTIIHNLILYFQDLYWYIKYINNLSSDTTTPYYIQSLRVIMASRKKKFNSELSPEEMAHGCRLGLDSHADVSCIGKHARVMEVFSGRVCNVQPFNDTYDSIKNVKTVNSAFAYDDEEGHTYILEVNQALDFTGSMEHSLLCPNQARIHGTIVNDVPKFLDHTGNSTHSVIPARSKVDIPLSMNGPVSYIPVRYPTDEEMDQCEHLTLTDPDSEWDPQCLNGISSVSSLETTPIVSSSHPIDSALLYEGFYELLESKRYISAVNHRAVRETSPEMLSTLWKVPINYARQTLQSTTQSSVQLNEGAFSKRFKTKVHHTRYRQLGGYLGMFASDTFKSNITSTRGNKYTQLFCNRGNFVKSYPMKKKSHASHALDRFLHEVGVPNEMLTDGAKELTLGEWGATCRKKKIKMETTEPHSPWQNHSERIGGLIKRKVKNMMRSTNTPLRLWDYCWEYCSSLRSLTASDHIMLDGATPFEKVFNYTPDIAEYLLFGWYDWIWYHDTSKPDETQLGRWLGPSINSGQSLASCILTSTGKVITRSTVSAIDLHERKDPNLIERQRKFDEDVNSVIGNYTSATNENISDDFDANNPYDSIFEKDSNDDENLLYEDESKRRPDADSYLAPKDSPFAENSDTHIGVTMDLPHQGEMKRGTIKRRKRDHDGNLIGKANNNPTLDSRIYEVEFGDGTYADYSTNVLMENLYSQIDDDGQQYALMVGIVDHMKLKEAVPTDSGFYYTSNGTKKRVITTKGWKLKVEWYDGSSTWVPLAELKEANPVETAEYAVKEKIDSEPAFAWWVQHVLRKRDRFIKQVQHRVPRKAVKFGVKVPASVKEALLFDKENGNDFWQKAIDKEIGNVKVAFQLLSDGEKPPPGSKLIPYHIIFDVRFDLTRKARLVAGGHRNKDVPQHNRYSSVASRESVRIGLLIAALNNLSIAATDIGNAYLNAPPKERVHVVVGPELFGQDHEGKTATVVRALYGLKSAGNAWRHYFANYIHEQLRFLPTKADPDVWRKPEVKPNGERYYAYLIVYVDDVLCIHHDPKSVMDIIGGDFRLKNGVDNNPSNYLGADIRSWKYINEDEEESDCWAMGSKNYVKEAIRICESQMKAHDLSYSSTRRHGRNTPFTSSSYRPELDNTDYCNAELLHLFQQLIGILRWICELGRIDIVHEVSILSQYLAQPRIGHLQQTLNIFYYIKHNNKSWLVLDPTTFDIDWQPIANEPSPQDRAAAMREIYPDAIDELPHDMPEPLGNPVDITIFVDADHAGNRVTRRSHTGIIIYLNTAPVLWFSKRQNTVETSTFGSEFIAMKIAAEMNDSLLYKLRMFGIPISGPSRVLCDNDAVVKSSSFAESTLKKKHCSIAYHRVRESVASGKLLIYYEHTSSNLADLLTKVMNAAKRNPLIKGILS